MPLLNVFPLFFKNAFHDACINAAKIKINNIFNFN